MCNTPLRMGMTVCHRPWKPAINWGTWESFCGGRTHSSKILVFGWGSRNIDGVGGDRDAIRGVKFCSTWSRDSFHVKPTFKSLQMCTKKEANQDFDLATPSLD